MDGNDLIATLKKHLLQELLTDQNEKLIEVDLFDPDASPTASASTSENIFKYKTDSPSSAQSIVKFKTASPTNTEYISELLLTDQNEKVIEVDLVDADEIPTAPSFTSENIFEYETDSHSSTQNIVKFKSASLTNTEDISELLLTDKTEKVIEVDLVDAGDVPTAPASTFENIFEYETDSHSSAQNIVKFKSASLTNTEDISELLLTDQNEKVAEVDLVDADDIPTAPASTSENILEHEIDSPSPAQSIVEFKSASPTDTGYMCELDEISSYIEYLDETEEEFRLSESIQRSKEKAESKMSIQSRKLNVDKPVSKDSNLRNINMKIGIKGLGEDEDEIQYHHENLRIVLRYSNANTFVCRGIWYLCTLCPIKYTNPRELKAHTLKFHNTMKSQRKLYSARKMDRYVVKLDITNLKCKLCAIGISSLKDLMEHLYTEHGQPVHRDLPSHLIPFKFDSDVFRCTECDREFAFFKMLLCHMNDHYKNYTCKVCDTGYVSSGSLTQHMRLHADGEYTCERCKKLFDNKYKLADHIKLVHFGKKMRNKCAYCDMKFHVFETRNKHMEEVHGVKTPIVKCQACEKCFKSTRHLTAHMKNFHLIAEKNHQCSQCDKRFSAPHMLKAHMTAHSTERDFKCVVCDKAFSRKKTLREHIRIHANDRRFKCEFCGMAFVQKCSLKLHVKTKHADKNQE